MISLLTILGVGPTFWHVSACTVPTLPSNRSWRGLSTVSTFFGDGGSNGIPGTSFLPTNLFEGTKRALSAWQTANLGIPPLGNSSAVRFTGPIVDESRADLVFRFTQTISGFPAETRVTPGIFNLNKATIVYSTLYDYRGMYSTILASLGIALHEIGHTMCLDDVSVSTSCPIGASVMQGAYPNGTPVSGRIDPSPDDNDAVDGCYFNYVVDVSCAPIDCPDRYVFDDIACQCRCETEAGKVAQDGQGNCISPLVIDVTGGGYQLTSLEAGVYFDLTNQGYNRLTSWTGQGVQNGWLCLDRNSNGTIDNGTELFGDNTPKPNGTTARDGFDALAIYDQPAYGGNGSRVLDPGDSIWSQLRIWIDSNHDGISQTSELTTLGTWGLTSLGIAGTLDGSFTDANGNFFHLRAAAIFGSGASRRTRWYYDVILQVGAAQPPQ
jgi:hypothetical protein